MAKHTTPFDRDTDPATAARNLRWRLEAAEPGERLAAVAAWACTQFAMSGEEQADFLAALDMHWGVTAMGMPVVVPDKE